jgi:transcriptional regulator with XRE-family HTH domain
LRNILRNTNVQDAVMIPEIANVAANLKRARAATGWSQQDLADAAGISRRMITLIEASDANPSIATLAALAAPLGLSFADLIRAEATRDQPVEVWRGAHRQSRATLLESLDARRTVELWLWSLGPSDHYHAEPDPAGMSEIVYVLEGALIVETEDSSACLAAGQSFSFASDQRYTYINPGHTLTRFIKNVVI